MGVQWRAIKDKSRQSITGTWRREYGYGPRDKFLQALKAEICWALLTHGGSCPHGKPAALDSFDLHWGTAEDTDFRPDPEEPRITLRWACRHEDGAGTFSPVRGVVSVRPSIEDPTTSERMNYSKN